jgi:hypothetical protein
MQTQRVTAFPIFVPFPCRNGRVDWYARRHQSDGLVAQGNGGHERERRPVHREGCKDARGHYERPASATRCLRGCGWAAARSRPWPPQQSIETKVEAEKFVMLLPRNRPFTSNSLRHSDFIRGESRPGQRLVHLQRRRSRLYYSSVPGSFSGQRGAKLYSGHSAVDWFHCAGDRTLTASIVTPGMETLTRYLNNVLVFSLPAGAFASARGCTLNSQHTNRLQPLRGQRIDKLSAH